MSESLYNLSTELAKVNEELVDSEGAISPELESQLDSLLPAIALKSVSICRWLVNIDGNLDAIETETERLKKRGIAAEELKARLRSYLKDSMVRAGLTKYDAGIFTLSIQKNPPSVKIIQEEAIAPQYKLTKLEVVIDKTLIADSLKAGISVEGAELVQGTRLQIK